MWRRIQTLAPAVRRAAAAAGAAPSPAIARAAPLSTAAAAFRRTTPLLSGDKPATASPTVEDIMPIATGHEREELEAELQGTKRFDMDPPVGPFGTKNPLQALTNGVDPMSRVMQIRKLNDGINPPVAENELAGGDRMGGTGGFAGGDRMGGFAGGDRMSGFAGGDRMGGTGSFAGGDRMGGFAGGDRMGGFAGGDRMGGFAGGDRMGGFAGGDRMGGFAGGERLGGFAGGDRMGGFTGGDRMGGNGGFTPGGRMAGGFTPGSRMTGNGGFTTGGGRTGRFNMDLLQPTGQRVKRDVLHITQKGKKTFVTVTDVKGNRKAGASAGCLEDRKGRSRLARYAGEATGEHMGRAARKMGIKSVVVRVKGYSFFRKKKKIVLGFADGFRGERVRTPTPIMYIHDVTQLAHNGCRLPKKTRK